MPTTAPKLPTVATSTGAGGPWSYHDNVEAIDNKYAFTHLWPSVPATSKFLDCTSFGITLSEVPNTATITGIEVDVNGFCAPIQLSGQAMLIKSGTAVGSNKYFTFNYTIPTTQKLGAGSLWNTAWTATDLTDPDFGVRIWAENKDMMPNTSMKIDYIQVTISYSVTTPAGGKVYQMIF